MYKSRSRKQICVVAFFFLILHNFILLTWSTIDIVSVVDKSSAPSCLIKLFSVEQSMQYQKQLSLKFLVFESSEFTVSFWESAVANIFPGIPSQSKPWYKPITFPSLSEKGFAKEEVFARFYFPTIFPESKRFIFLDNDIIVTEDMYNLYHHRLHLSNIIPGTFEISAPPPVVNPRSISRTVQRPTGGSPLKKIMNSNSNSHHDPATVGFVFEHHPGYKEYLHRHFSMENSEVKTAIESHGSDVFLNAGVFVVDALRWAKKGITRRMEELMERNIKDKLFNTEALGDQGPFMLLFANDSAYLSPTFNMRRQPKKTLNLLSSGVTGIVHFAGTTHADAGHLCRFPLQHPALLNGALPLYLSVVHAFLKKHSSVRNSTFYSSVAMCDDAIPVVQAELRRLSLKAVYNPGLGRFLWPPS